MQLKRIAFGLLSRVLAPALALLLGVATAATLPEERADFFYHLYDGGGQTVQGPALSARKNFRERASVNAGLYVDDITGASIDVVTSASEYHETRTEYRLGGDWLQRDTLISGSYVSSSENDYEAQSYNLALAYDFFGGMSTLALNYGHGDDEVGRVDSSFSEGRTRDSYGVSLTQLLSPNTLAVLSYDNISDEGYLQNPYRSARVLGAAVPEVYPGTLTSNALGLSLQTMMNPGWSLRGNYRFHTDSWGVVGHTLGIGSSHQLGGDRLLDLRARYYQQQAADFYGDNFSQPLTYMARDKELSTFSSYALGSRFTMPVFSSDGEWVRKARVSLSADYMSFSYDDFTDIRSGEAYSFDAWVVQAYLSVFY